MIRSLYTAASGMKTQQMNVDTISNNLANVNTTGFKKKNDWNSNLYYMRHWSEQAQTKMETVAQ